MFEAKGVLVASLGNQVHLWYTLPDAITDPGLSGSLEGLLSSRELGRYQQLSVPRVRREYLISRAFLRTVLSRYANIDPRAWRFNKNAYGRPGIELQPGAPPLCFSLSHTDGLIAVIVAVNRAVGLDAENTERQVTEPRVEERVLSASELEALRSLPAESRRLRFLEYWTLKEAYVKARGLGLSMPLAQFSFDIAHGSPPRISFDPGFEDDPLHWQFAQFRLTPQTLAAVAIHRDPARELDIRVKQTIPLVS